MPRYTSPAPSGTTLFQVLLEFTFGVRPNSLETLKNKIWDIINSAKLVSKARKWQMRQKGKKE
jgi:hypothetical protein